MEKRPCISVIIPVYQVERYLRKCLDTLLSQTFEDFEVILVDDGSTDKSSSICDEYARKDKRFRVFHQQNGGVSCARNKGLKESKGEYLIFIDSDDWIQDDFFSMIQPYFGRFDIIILGLDLVSPDGCSIRKYVPPFEISENDTTKLADILYALFRINLLGYMGGTVIRRDIVATHSLKFDESFSLHEDSLFFLDCCKYASTFVSLAQTPYKYVYYEKESRQTLSNTVPTNYKKILQLQLRKVSELLSSIGMRKRERSFIEGRLMYNYCRVSIDLAMSQKQERIRAIKDCIAEFSDKEIIVCSVKEFMLYFLVKKKMPYMIYIVKKLLSIVK